MSEEHKETGLRPQSVITLGILLIGAGIDFIYGIGPAALIAGILSMFSGAVWWFHEQDIKAEAKKK